MQVKGARTSAVTMQLTQLFALTPALSPRERENVVQLICESPSSASKADDNSPSPIRWERAGERVRTISNCMVTPSGGQKSKISRFDFSFKKFSLANLHKVTKLTNHYPKMTLEKSI